MYRIAYSTLCTALLSTAALAGPATQSTPPTPVAPVELAQASAPTVVGNTTAAVPPADKKVCRLLPSSYSHRMDRVCLTKDEWKQVDDQMR